jgi:hypothetical protein
VQPSPLRASIDGEREGCAAGRVSRVPVDVDGGAFRVRRAAKAERAHVFGRDRLWHRARGAAADGQGQAVGAVVVDLEVVDARGHQRDAGRKLGSVVDPPRRGAGAGDAGTRGQQDDREKQHLNERSVGHDEQSPSRSGGPDACVLRIPGATARAHPRATATSASAAKTAQVERCVAPGAAAQPCQSRHTVDLLCRGASQQSRRRYHGRHSGPRQKGLTTGVGSPRHSVPVGVSVHDIPAGHGGSQSPGSHSPFSRLQEKPGEQRPQQSPVMLRFTAVAATPMASPPAASPYSLSP